MRGSRCRCGSWVVGALTCALLAAVAAGCGDSSLKAAGETCFGSAECQQGLTCDVGSDPPVCREGQTGRSDASTQVPIDAGRRGDGPLPVDAAAGSPDAADPIDASPDPDAPAIDAGMS